MERKRILILGAAGRDFHNFNMLYREDESVEVVGFTATQIPKIAGRRYPAELAGPLYPTGVPIYEERLLESLVKEHQVDEVVFSYSDISHEAVMHLASRALAAGAGFSLPSAEQTMLRSSKPVLGILATRTGCGKSQVSRYLAKALKSMGKTPVVVRHPMPYGSDLRKQRLERFATYEDFARYDCTIEEREEYETHVQEGIVVYAGVDYEAILRQAEQEADIVIWDGGNNDLPFFRPDVWVTVTDPLRVGHELRYHPGETNLRRADIILVNKANAAEASELQRLLENIRSVHPEATCVVADSLLHVDDPSLVAGKRVLCIDDGPTLTHGEMSFGAGQRAAEQYGAKEIVDPRPCAVGSLKETLERFPHIGRLLPAMGYFPEQIADLEASIRAVDCDVVLIATPVDLGRLVKIEQPSTRVHYTLADRAGEPSLWEVVRSALFAS
ncbi:MAG: GTPase [Myxococcales bacterium]|nr:GTPase [Myxococcales bacterium]